MWGMNVYIFLCYASDNTSKNENFFHACLNVFKPNASLLDDNLLCPVIFSDTVLPESLDWLE